MNIPNPMYGGYPNFWLSRTFPFMDSFSNDDVNIFEKDDMIEVQVAVPGIKGKNIDLTYDRGLLKIQANQIEDLKKEEELQDKVHKSQLKQSFDYSIDLPRIVDPETISARSKLGVLHIEAEIAPESRQKKIPIKVEE